MPFLTGSEDAETCVPKVLSTEGKNIEIIILDVHVKYVCSRKLSTRIQKGLTILLNLPPNALNICKQVGRNR